MERECHGADDGDRNRDRQERFRGSGKIAEQPERERANPRRVHQRGYENDHGGKKGCDDDAGEYQTFRRCAGAPASELIDRERGDKRTGEREQPDGSTRSRQRKPAPPSFPPPRRLKRRVGKAQRVDCATTPDNSRLPSRVNRRQRPPARCAANESETGCRTGPSNHTATSPTTASAHSEARGGNGSLPTAITRVRPQTRALAPAGRRQLSTSAVEPPRTIS